MKDGTENLLKFKLVQRDLGLSLWEMRGLLDSVWYFTKTNCPRGDLGRYTAEEIAVFIGWDRCEPEKLIEVLINRRWLDVDDECGCRVHDWAEHCESSVHRTLALQGLTFADGTEPSDSRLSAPEKERARKKRDANIAAAARQPHGSRTATLPSPAPPSLAPPEQPAAARLPGRSGAKKQDRIDLTLAVLNSQHLMRQYALAESKRSDAWFSSSEEDLNNVLAVAAKVTSTKCDDPVAVAKWMLRGKHWDFLSASHEEIAKAMRRKSRAVVGRNAEAVPDGELQHLGPTLGKLAARLALTEATEEASAAKPRSRRNSA